VCRHASFDERDRVLQPGEHLLVDGVAIGVRAKAFQEVDDEPEEDVRIGKEELRLVVVADQRQSTLQYPPLIDVGDLGREVMALDAVRVVEEVEGVIDGEAKAGASCHQPLMHFGRDAHLGDLV